MTLRRRLILAALLALTAAVGAACGEKTSSRPAAPSAESRAPDARLPAQRRPRRRSTRRRRRGDFRAGRARRDDHRRPSDPSAPLKLLAAGKVDLAISYEPELLLARDKGRSSSSVGALVQKPLTSIMSLGQGEIKDPAQLKGKTVGTAGIPYQSAYLKTILAKAPASTRRRSRRSTSASTSSRRCSPTRSTRRSARSGTSRASSCSAQHKQPTIIRMEQAGVPTYDELVVVAAPGPLARGAASVVRRFLRALARGARGASSRTRPSASTRCVKANQTSTAGCRPPRSRRRCRLLPRRTGQARSAT